MRSTPLTWTLSLLTAAALTACGGGSDSTTVQASAANAACPVKA